MQVSGVAIWHRELYNSNGTGADGTNKPLPLKGTASRTSKILWSQILVYFFS